MDLGIEGRNAILFASSRGLGRACAAAIAREGVNVVVNGRTADNVTINQLLPERIDTDRQRYMAQRAMDARGVTYEEARAEQEASINAGRLGTPEEFGDAFAYLCAARSGYLSGQNLQLDGGSYEGVF